MRILSITIIMTMLLLVSCGDTINEVTEVQPGGNTVVINGARDGYQYDIRLTGADTVVVYNIMDAHRDTLWQALDTARVKDLRIHGHKLTVTKVYDTMAHLRRLTTDGKVFKGLFAVPNLQYLECEGVRTMDNTLADTVVYKSAQEYGDTTGMVLIQVDKL